MVLTTQRWISLCAFALICLSSCSGGPGSTEVSSAEPEPAIAAFPAIESTLEISLPMDAYRLTYDEQVQVIAARSRLTQACASRFGVEYETSLESAVHGSIPPIYDANKSLYAYRYYVSDMNVAEWGYVVPPGLPPAPVSAPSGPDTEDEYVQMVLNGLEPGPQPPALKDDSLVQPGPGAFPTGVERPVDANGDPLPLGGCVGEAVTILSGGSDAVYSEGYMDRIDGGPYFRALEDSRVQEVTRQWSSCMAEQGYDYPTPEEATSDPAWLQADEQLRPLPEEVPVAVADVECKRKVNYVGVRVAVEAAYQEREIEMLFEDLELNYRNGREQVRRADEFLTGTASGSG